jgi:hypothetical protein
VILDATTKKLEILLGGAVTANQLPFQCEWVDVTASASTPGTNGGLTNGATPVDLVGVPGASTQRIVNGINIYNADTVPQTVTIRYNDNATLRTLKTVTLAVGDTLTWSLADLWEVVDSSGNKKNNVNTGNWLKTTVLTAGTSFTTQPATHTIFVRLQAGGGGGGGCASVASSGAAAGGGGAGGYAEKTFAVSPNTAYTYAIGGAGAGNSGAAGGNGGNTTFAVGATTVTANGGTGAGLATGTTTLTAWAGGSGGTVSTNGDLNDAGVSGHAGVVLIIATPIVASGKGGDSMFGNGGKGLVAVGAGNAATGFGGGGGGSASGASAARAGGAGTAGCIIVDEYA